MPRNIHHEEHEGHEEWTAMAQESINEEDRYLLNAKNLSVYAPSW